MNIKIAQTTQNSWNFIVGKSSLLKKWQISAIIREIQTLSSETGRYGPKKSGVSRIIRKSWQHCTFPCLSSCYICIWAFSYWQSIEFFFYYQQGIFLYSFTNLFTTKSKVFLHFFFISDWHPHFSLSRTLFVCFHWSSVCISGHKINSIVKSCY